MWQLWIDTGGTFTDGLARDPNGILHRTKVLSSSRLRGQLINGRLVAPWLTAAIFDDYTVRIVETGATHRIESLSVAGTLVLAATTDAISNATVELYTDEEAPVLAARLLTQTPLRQPFPRLEMRLGTTKGTNALLERKGARVALLVTEGFRDLLVIGTQQRPNLFQLAIPPAEVLYDTVLEVPERLAADGSVIQPLTAETIITLIAQLHSLQPDAVAISLLNAYRNPAHEQQLANALVQAGFTSITLSTTVSTAPGYVSRTQTTVADAYLTPVLATYLQNVQTQLGGAPVRVMSSAGGLVRADLFQPKDSLLSGPAGGVIGAAAVAAAAVAAAAVAAASIASGEAVLTLDMGGTSTDVARIANGQPDYRFSTPIGPFELQLPSLAIETVAAGGGSICWFDALTGQLRVGPHSAGANPGPACYGATPPERVPALTITDVNLLLGRLHPQQFGIPIFPKKAQQALDEVVHQVSKATNLSTNAQELLLGFAQIADETMAGAIRKISVARGFDPADYSLLVFGGAGGLHGCSVAERLGMKRLLLPFDGGLLSAYGIGQAAIERRASRTVLQPLHQVYDQLDALLNELQTTVGRELSNELPGGVGTVTYRHWLYLRLLGQEQPIELALPDSWLRDKDAYQLPKLVYQFHQAYQRLYGYVPEGRAIEVESLRVVASTLPEYHSKTEAKVAPRPVPVAFHTAAPSDRSYPAYDWTQLQPGDQFDGPALLLNTTSSAFIEANWAVTIDTNKTAVGERRLPPALKGAFAPQDHVAEQKLPLGQGVSDAPASNVIQLELFTQRFRAIADEMGAQLQRTAFSVNVKERLDFSCALLDADARLVVNAPHIPVHLGSLGICARLVLAELTRQNTPLGPGDVAITNHPEFGGSHLPDVTLLQGVYDPAGTLLGYVINRAHHAEIGGKTPGSMPPDATSLVEEGVVLAPRLLVRDGQFLWDDDVETLFTQATYPTRALAENRADLEAAIASLRAGDIALQNLVQTHGHDQVRTYMTRLQASATQAIMSVLAKHEGQTFDATETLDDGSPIQVRITAPPTAPQPPKGELSAAKETGWWRSLAPPLGVGGLLIDLRGTGPVHPNNLNANVSILHSAVLYVLRLWVGEHIDATHIPLNEGLMTPVRFILPDSSLLNPVFPNDPTKCPAVVGGNTEVSQRLVDTLLKALGLAACSQGTMNNFLFGNDTLGYYETIGGGAGATRGQAGRSGVHQHMTNTRLTDPETLERRYPVRLWRFGLRDRSGGAGTWRGGDGLVREIEFLEPMQVTLVSQHRTVAPYGLGGGAPGQPGRQWLIDPTGTETPLPGLFSRQVRPGERIRIETPGGGGVNE